jgi:hypothetical protein
MYFSQSNILLHPHFSYVDTFLIRDRVLLPIHMKGVLVQNDEIGSIPFKNQLSTHWQTK